ncbi:hypothetical protein J6590_034026, partial [Homalodisca vitripennis]
PPVAHCGLAHHWGRNAVYDPRHIVRLVSLSHLMSSNFFMGSLSRRAHPDKFATLGEPRTAVWVYVSSGFDDPRI